jgi:hypothetical protein
MIKDLDELIRTMKICKSFYLHTEEKPITSKFFNPEEECSEFVTSYWRSNNCPPETEPCTMFFPVSDRLKPEAEEMLSKTYAVKCMFCNKIDTPLKFLHHLHKSENNDPPTKANAVTPFLYRHRTKSVQAENPAQPPAGRRKLSADGSEQAKRNLACPGCENSEQFVLFLPGCLPR